jgi:hypothetical protein
MEFGGYDGLGGRSCFGLGDGKGYDLGGERCLNSRESDRSWPDFLNIVSGLVDRGDLVSVRGLENLVGGKDDGDGGVRDVLCLDRLRGEYLFGDLVRDDYGFRCGVEGGGRVDGLREDVFGSLVDAVRESGLGTRLGAEGLSGLSERRLRNLLGTVDRHGLSALLLNSALLVNGSGSEPGVEALSGSRHANGLRQHLALGSERSLGTRHDLELRRGIGTRRDLGPRRGGLILRRNLRTRHGNRSGDLLRLLPGVHSKRVLGHRVSHQGTRALRHVPGVNTVSVAARREPRIGALLIHRRLNLHW